MIPVLIAENHSVVRAGLEGLLENADDIEVVGAAADGEEAVALARERHPAVVLMDLSMPVMGGVEATRLILDADPGARVVVLSAQGHRARRALERDQGGLPR